MTTEEFDKAKLRTKLVLLFRNSIKDPSMTLVSWDDWSKIDWRIMGEGGSACSFKRKVERYKYIYSLTKDTKEEFLNDRSKYIGLNNETHESEQSTIRINFVNHSAQDYLFLTKGLRHADETKTKVEIRRSGIFNIWKKPIIATEHLLTEKMVNVIGFGNDLKVDLTDGEADELRKLFNDEIQHREEAKSSVQRFESLVNKYKDNQDITPDENK